jgi:hydroxyacylglutathione hydrolase
MLQCAFILTTHHHGDHAGGNKTWRTLYPDVPVIGGAADHCAAVTQTVKHNAVLACGELSIRCLETPCHTRGHMCFYVTPKQQQEEKKEQKAKQQQQQHQSGGIVFSGDTLFSGGCGRFFEGDGADMYQALCVTLGALPDTCVVYSGHEYTAQNLRFAAAVEPDNAALRAKIAWTAQRRSAGLPTYSTMAEERAVNPFVRVVSSKAVRAYCGATSTSKPGDVMAALRLAKNRFGLGAAGKTKL